MSGYACERRDVIGSQPANEAMAFWEPRVRHDLARSSKADELPPIAIGGDSQGADAFSLTTRRLSADACLVCAQGEIDVTAEAFRKALQEGTSARARRLFVDLSKLTFLPTPAIDALIDTRDNLAERGGELVVVAGADEIHDILSLTMLDQLFPVFRTRAEALVAFGFNTSRAGAPVKAAV